MASHGNLPKLNFLVLTVRIRNCGFGRVTITLSCTELNHPSRSKWPRCILSVQVHVSYLL